MTEHQYTMTAVKDCSCPRCTQFRTPGAVVDMTGVEGWPTVQPSPYSEPNAQGRKDDQQKIRVDLYPPSAILATSRGLTYGEKKYAAWNWAKGIHYMRVYGALLRHLFAWVMGEKVDPESGLHHLDHAGCCLAFLQHYESDPERYKQFDDRPECLVKK